jgi:hypothetical protein
VQTRALQRIAASWVQADAYDAVNQARFLPDDLRRNYQASIASEWSLLDPVEYLNFVRTGSPAPELLIGIPVAAAADPQGALATADTMAGPVAVRLRAAALQALAETGDPLTVIARIDAMGPDPTGNEILEVIARSFARSDPDAALAWAETRASPIRIAVITQLVESDPGRIPELIDAMMRPDPNTPLPLTSLLTRLGRDPANAPLFADRLLERHDGQSANALGNVITGWAGQDPRSAMDWVVDNAVSMNPALLDQLAGAFADIDVEIAAAYLDEIPFELRSSWLTGVAGSFARQNPQAASDWLERFRGQAGYGQAIQYVVAQMAGTAPAEAAAIAGRAGAAMQPSTAGTVAGNWARQDPDAAARWALGMVDSRARRSAVGAVAMNWARRDPDAAIDWAEALPEDALRETALSNLLLNSAILGQDALGKVLIRIAERSPDEAQALLDRHVRNEAVRRRIEVEISASPSANQSGVLP